MKMSRMISGLMAAAAIATMATSVTGCATASALRDHDLSLQMAMTDSLFVAPSAEKRVLVEFRNVSSKAGLDVADKVRHQIASHGYTLVEDPALARYILQVSILSAGPLSANDLNSALKAGFGSPLGTAVIGAGAAHASGGNTRQIEAAALVSAVVDEVGSLFVKSESYGVIADVQVSERASSSGGVKVVGVQKTPKGQFGAESQNYAENSDWKRYRTRLVAMARQTNLKWEDAEPLLAGGVAHSLGGMF